MFPSGLFCFGKCLHDIKFLPLSVNVWEVWKEAADSWEKDAVGTQGSLSPWLVLREAGALHQGKAGAFP